MKYVVTRAVIYYDGSQENKSVIYPNIKVDDVKEYKVKLKSLVVCDRIYLNFEECD